MSSVGRGILASLPPQSIERGRAGGGGRCGRYLTFTAKSDAATRNARGAKRRLYLLEETTWTPLHGGTKSHHIRCISHSERRRGNDKLRFELGVLLDGKTEAIRAPQGHSLGIGVGPDVLPIAEDVFYVVRGTSLSDAQRIAARGLNRGGRIHMDFLARNRSGLLEGVHQAMSGPQAIVIADATMARDDGIQFYRSANDVFMPDGIDGVTPPLFIRSIRLLPSYDLLRANEDRMGKADETITNGNPSE